MGRIYAVEENGEKHLVALECDCCDARIKPGADIMNSGWEKQIYYNDYTGEVSDVTYICPDCRANGRE